MNTTNYEQAFQLIRSDYRADIQKGIDMFYKELESDRFNDDLIYSNIAYGYYRLRNTNELIDLLYLTNNSNVAEYLYLDAKQNKKEAKDVSITVPMIAIGLLGFSIGCCFQNELIHT